MAAGPGSIGIPITRVSRDRSTPKSRPESGFADAIADLKWHFVPGNPAYVPPLLAKLLPKRLATTGIASPYDFGTLAANGQHEHVPGIPVPQPLSNLRA